jgi:hypothetical protein
VTLPQSALQGATLVLGVFDEVKDQLGRYSIRSIESTYQAGSGGPQRPDTVKVALDLSFFGDSAQQATTHYEALDPALRSKPWCVNVETRGSKEFDEKAPSHGISVQNFVVTCDLSKLVKS